MAIIYPGQTIGIIGSNQKAYLLALAAKNLGFRIAILVDLSQPNRLLQAIADEQIEGSTERLGDLAALGDISDVLTYTDEFIDETFLEKLAGLYNLPQGSNVLSVTQDRYMEKVFLTDLNINILPYITVIDGDDIRQNIDAIGYPCILKPIQKGYGKQYQRLIKSEADIDQIDQFMALGSYLLESWIPATRELSVIVTKSQSGDIVAAPVIENQFEQGQLSASLVPGRIDPDVAQEVERLAEVIGKELDYVGTFGIEFFLTPDDNIYVKRIIPTLHKTGDVLTHTLTYSQYTYHLKAICGWAIGMARLQSSGVTLPVQTAQLPLIKTQLKIKPDWYFDVFPGDNTRFCGSVTATGHELKPLIANFEAADLL